MTLTIMTDNVLPM